VAREKACEHPELACHGESCPLARGFYDRLPAARAEAVGTPTWDRTTLRELARRHAICPYYLAQELVRWADVVVGDYNHFFDPSAMLHALATGGERRVALLVDEAHNLVERARRMYSAELDEEALTAVRRAAPAALKRPLERVRRHRRTLVAAQQVEYAVHEGPPRGLVAALQEAAAAITDHLAEHPDGASPEVQQFAFDALHFVQRAESFGEHSLFDVGLAGRGRSRLCIRNVVPAGFLAPRFAAARSATLFSATLSPAAYHAEMLGLPADTGRLDVDSPFDAAQLAVRIAGGLSTRWRDREGSLAPIAELIGRQFEARPGNYLAFFSSFDYLERALERFGARHPQVPVWRQARGMSEAEQAAFLARFVAGGRGVGFAVLGGAFAEGVDLPGERLIGAFIATLGLPQVNPINEEIRARLERLCGRGFDYAYLYPGLQKVVQAAGRVIRTPEDRGVVHLLDERFGRRDVRALLTAWWRIECGAEAQQRRPASAGRDGGGAPGAGSRRSGATAPGPGRRSARSKRPPWRRRSRPVPATSGTGRRPRARRATPATRRPAGPGRPAARTSPRARSRRGAAARQARRGLPRARGGRAGRRKRWRAAPACRRSAGRRTAGRRRR
jgi:Rad3-related DNA helicase